MTDICIGTAVTKTSLENFNLTLAESVLITLGTLVIKEGFWLVWKIVLLKNPALARKFDLKVKRRDELEGN